MTFKRGEIWIADLNPVQGSVQSGTRPVIIFQNENISRFSSTIIIIPLTSNLRRTDLPTAMIIESEESCLDEKSVALCHQIRVIDNSRLLKRIGELSND